MYTNHQLKSHLHIALGAILLSAAVSVYACPYDNAAEGSNTLFVSAAGSDLTSCGLTKTTACKSINKAVVRAVAEGLMTDTTIYVAPGTYSENVAAKQAFNGLTFQGSGASGVCQTTINPPNGSGFNAPAGVPVNYGILVVFAQNTNISGFNVAFTETDTAVLEREVGVFLARPAKGATINDNAFSRATNAERAGPGSRGIFTILGGGHTLSDNSIACENTGAFEDAIHIPDHNINIHHNTICTANRVGIVSIQETSTSDSSHNNIHHNTIDNVLTGVEIQGDKNIVNKNSMGSGVNTPVVICGDGCDCHYVPSNPAGDSQFAESTIVMNNTPNAVVDCGVNTKVLQ